jgi:hypothetical protein
LGGLLRLRAAARAGNQTTRQVEACGVSVEFSSAHAIRFGAGPQDEYDIPKGTGEPVATTRPQAREPAEQPRELIDRTSMSAPSWRSKIFAGLARTRELGFFAYRFGRRVYQDGRPGPAVIAAPAHVVSLNPAYAGFVGAVWRARSPPFRRTAKVAFVIATLPATPRAVPLETTENWHC